jgi:hypothetical protein
MDIEYTQVLNKLSVKIYLFIFMEYLLKCLYTLKIMQQKMQNLSMHASLKCSINRLSAEGILTDCCAWRTYKHFVAPLRRQAPET